MAPTSRLARQTFPRLLLRPRFSSLSSPTRTFRNFTNHARPLCSALQQSSEGFEGRKGLRQFSRSSCLKNQSQIAPNAKAYLESGVIAGGQNLVDVKKVLVIGSGGLSIGQAGEFDYS
ncbi:hypothetical protein LTR28_012429, partial [Elasticomyces elasticus]